MAINGALDGLKKDVMKNLSKEKLKQYIFFLSKRYYETYINNDEEAFLNTIESLHDVVNEYSVTYVNLIGFTFFCLFLNANVVLTKAGANKDMTLENVFTYDLLEDDDFEDDLHHDLRNILNKERVRARYYEKRASEFIE